MRTTTVTVTASVTATANATRRAVAVLVATLVLVLAACSGDDDQAVDDGTAATATTAMGGEAGAIAPADVEASPSAGCEADRPARAGDRRVTTTSDGHERWYLRHVPEAYDGTTPMPLVVDFHGYSEGAQIHVSMSGLSAFGDEQGFITLTPQGRGRVPLWDTTFGGQDLTFVGDLLDEAEDSLCIDTNRIYVTGLSNGAFMTSAVACQYADRVAAVAPVAGVRDIDGCEPSRPVPVVAFHGTADRFLTFEGGPGPAVADLPAPDGSDRSLADVQPSEDTGDASEGSEGGEAADEGERSVTGADPAPGDPSVPEVVAAWANRNGCDAEPEAEAVADDVRVERYSCPPGADAELYRIINGGHTWPGSDFSASIESIVGKTTMSISANEVMWDFFEDHPLTDR
jgi:polyhydroxybutyrate depolymerase